MRVAVIAVLLLVVATPSSASNSCMTQTEARQRFATSHLYWHGPDHCWDATPNKRRLTRTIQQKDDPEVQQEDQQPKWREAMSKLLPADAQPPQSPMAKELHAPGHVTGNASILDRWVRHWSRSSTPELRKNLSRHFNRKTNVRSSWPTISSSVVIILFGIMLMLAVIDFYVIQVSLLTSPDAAGVRSSLKTEPLRSEPNLIR